MRALLVLPLLSLVLLTAATPAQAIICGPVQPVGDFIDCWYERGTDAVGRIVDDVTDIIDEPWTLFEEPLRTLVYCALNPSDPSCWA